MKLEITQGELKEGYFWTILNDKGEAIACGYYRFENHAKYYGEKALSAYQKVGA